MEILKRKKNTEAHPYIPELKDLYARGRISRREFLRTATLLGMSLTSATAFVAACGPAEPTTAPAAEATQAPAAATAVPQPTAAPAGPKRGGTLTIATRVQRVDHPARLSWIEGVNQWRQVCEYLTYTGTKDGVPVSCTSCGIGPSPTAIGVEELIRIGTKNIIRIGTCGVIQPGIKPGDMINQLNG